MGGETKGIVSQLTKLFQLPSHAAIKQDPVTLPKVHFHQD